MLILAIEWLLAVPTAIEIVLACVLATVLARIIIVMVYLHLARIMVVLATVLARIMTVLHLLEPRVVIRGIGSYGFWCVWVRSISSLRAWFGRSSIIGWNWILRIGVLIVVIGIVIGVVPRVRQLARRGTYR